MRLYYEIGLRSLRRAATYRSAFVAGILTNACFGVLISFVYVALYTNAGSVAGFSLSDALSYTWATQALISIGAGWIISQEITTSIRTGDVVTDLTRPWNFYGYWLSRSLGERGFNLLFRGSLTYLIGVLYFDARLPSLASLPPFAITIVLAMLLSFAFSFIVNLSAFWLIENTGVILLANIILSFFSGFLVPLAFFPPALQTVAALLPFQTITSLPVQIFLGKLSGAALWQALALQCAWLVALVALGLLLLRAAMRKVVVQGG